MDELPIGPFAGVTTFQKPLQVTEPKPLVISSDLGKDETTDIPLDNRCFDTVPFKRVFFRRLGNQDSLSVSIQPATNYRNA